MIIAWQVIWCPDQLLHIKSNHELNNEQLDPYNCLTLQLNSVWTTVDIKHILEPRWKLLPFRFNFSAWEMLHWCGMFFYKAGMHLAIHLWKARSFHLYHNLSFYVFLTEKPKIESNMSKKLYLVQARLIQSVTFTQMSGRHPAHLVSKFPWKDFAHLQINHWDNQMWASSASLHTSH